ncbi:MAG TPA: NAD(P)H-dependent oxidoreductase [Rhizomicrobium sp.]
MSNNILVVNGHPDPRPERFCAALCDAYSEGARARGCATRRLDVGALNLAALTAAPGGEHAWDGVEQAFRLVRAADRLAIFYPLWADGPPAPLRQMFDYVSRLNAHLSALTPPAKAARLVVTTELPAFLYRAKRGNEAKAPAPLCGVAAGEPLYIGSVDDISCAQRMRWLEQMRGFGQSLS